MLSPSEQLGLLAEMGRLLHDGRTMAEHAPEVFRLLRSVVLFHDARLTCWFQSARPGSRRQQFYSDMRYAPWDNRLMRQTALSETLVCRAASNETENDSDWHTYVGVPLRWQRHLWGVLEVRARAPEHLGPHDQELLATLMPALALAIAAEGEREAQETDNVVALARRADERLLTTAARAPLLAALEQQLNEPLSLHTLLTLLLRWSLDETGAEAGAICMVDHEHGELVMQVYEGYTPEMLHRDRHGVQRQRWSWEHGLAGRAARSGRALLVRDVSREAELRPMGDNLRAELAVPVVLDDRVLAVLVLDSPRSAAFGEAELEFVSALCDYAARPLLRAISYQDVLETSAQLGQVFGSLPTGLALLDSSGRVLRANPAWSTTWGLPEQPRVAPFHVPLDLVDALLPRLANPVRLIDFCAEEQQSHNDAQMITLSLTNPHQEVQVLSTPTRDSQGQLTGRLWMVSDVTREREVDRLKNEFVSIVSHELRTPLTSILGYTELLLVRSFEPADQRQFIQTVYDQATHLSQLVEDLLSASRLDAGRVQLNRWMVAPRQFIAELTSQLANLERHRLLIRLGDALPPVSIDRDKIRQVLLNLVTNAVKYSPDGGEIILSVQEVVQREHAAHPDLPDDHPPGHWVLVSVRDQGIGIAAEDIPRIWERFYRVDNTNTRRIGGTGLGLSIARSLVELHGGRIWVASTPGVGSLFAFTLPVATDMLPGDSDDVLPATG